MIGLLYRPPSAYVTQLVSLQDSTHKYSDVLWVLKFLVGDDELCLLKHKKANTKVSFDRFLLL